jgi:NodT family efflux transporter outer membrane factor (OMF) lipoprotein
MSSCAAALACLAGCVGPKPSLPEATTVIAPIEWRSAAGPTSAFAADWWNRFEDPGLSAAVQAALDHNDDIAIAAVRVEEARAQFRLARGQQLPSVDALVAGDRQRDVSPFGKAELQTVGEAELAISYDLDLFGRLAAASQAARAALLSTQSARDSLQLGVAASTASAYITLRSFDARLAVLQNTLIARKESLDFARRRVKAGYAPELDLAQAESEYRGTEQLIPAMQLAITRQENGLSILMGLSPREVVRANEISAIEVPEVPALMPSELLRRRPDIAAAEQQIVAADRSLDAARAAFMPDVRLSLSGAYVTSTLLADPIRIFSVGGSILAPLFEGGRLRAQADLASARRDEAAYGYRKAALNAFREVEDALAAVDRDAAQERALQSQRESLVRGLKFATNRYRAGYSPYLEQLDAQRALLSVELSVVQARADRLVAAVTLYQALGGGWSSLPIDHSRLE